VVEAARRMGIGSPLQANTSIALGTSEVTPLELTSAYVPFANGGYRPQVHFIRRITGADGKLLFSFDGGSAPRVVSPQVVGMMNSMMAGTVRSGTATKAAFGWPSAGKTGTSQNSRDAWFVGYTANLTTGVWFGNDDGAPMTAQPDTGRIAGVEAKGRAQRLPVRDERSAKRHRLSRRGVPP
jgi:penicillin-binding protein 1A